MMEYLTKHKKCMGVKMIRRDRNFLHVEILPLLSFREVSEHSSCSEGSSSGSPSSSLPVASTSTCTCTWLLDYVLSHCKHAEKKVYINIGLLFVEYRKHFPTGPTGKPAKATDLYQYLAVHGACLSLTIIVLANDVEFDISSHISQK
jgi:hypothetical protein